MLGEMGSPVKIVVNLVDTLKDPFDDILASEEGTNFGSETTIAICIDVPWCEMDYNGDGMRSVEDLLTLLSDWVSCQLHHRCQWYW